MNIDLLNFEEVGQLLALIEESAHIVICAHRSPDGDALGSSLGLAGYLRSQGKEPVVCVPDMFPDFLQWLPGAQAIMRFDKRPDEVRKLMAEADLIFCLASDSPTAWAIWLRRLPRVLPRVSSSTIILRLKWILY